jgi:hypothetical protein
MRLLRCNDAGDFSLTTFEDREIPPYAIVSHIWGPKDEEVSMKDIFDGSGRAKAGYEKLQFCGKQATQDGLHYFWIDTCCIDKSSSAELTEAINSMFAWYRNAARCYVYLDDVTALSPVRGDWNRAFRQSRWFIQAWTLQELLAPASVEFFSSEGQRLGDKISLVHIIHEITGIHMEALKGQSMADFSVDERMSWARGRQTKWPEDMAYSLMGIFDVQMPIVYGEGQERALSRLRREIEWESSNALHHGPKHNGNYNHQFAGHVVSPISDTFHMSAISIPPADSDDGSDIASVFSDGATSISSASSAGLNPVQTIGIREVSRTLLSMKDLKDIYTIAIINVERRKARSHIRGFLQDYGRSLLKEAPTSSLAIQAAKFVCELAGRIADEIIWNITGFTHSPGTDFEKRNLEAWLSTSQGGDVGIEEPSPSVTREDGDAMSDEGESDEELHDDLPFPHIDKVKDFLLNSQAFQEHITAMRTWLKVDDGVDRKQVRGPTMDAANHVDVVESIEDIIEDSTTSTESQQRSGGNCNEPVEIESDRGQETAHGHEPNPQSRHRRNSAIDLVSGLLDFWGISFFFYDIVELFVPRVPQGYRRLRWRCVSPCASVRV